MKHQVIDLFDRKATLAATLGLYKNVSHANLCKPSEPIIIQHLNMCNARQKGQGTLEKNVPMNRTNSNGLDRLRNCSVALCPVSVRV
jgi:hypothetical protein